MFSMTKKHPSLTHSHSHSHNSSLVDFNNNNTHFSTDNNNNNNNNSDSYSTNTGEMLTRDSFNMLCGVLLVLINLCLDGFTNNEQDEIFTTHHCTSLEMMKFLNVWQAIYLLMYLCGSTLFAWMTTNPSTLLFSSSPFDSTSSSTTSSFSYFSYFSSSLSTFTSGSALADFQNNNHNNNNQFSNSINIDNNNGVHAHQATVTSELLSSLTMLTSCPTLCHDLLLFCICAAVGQVLIFVVMQEFGSLVWITISITRKLFTILLSIFMFGHNVSVGQWVGIGCVFVGLSVESGMEYKHKHKMQQLKLQQQQNQLQQEKLEHLKQQQQQQQQQQQSTIDNEERKEVGLEHPSGKATYSNSSKSKTTSTFVTSSSANQNGSKKNKSKGNNNKKKVA